MTGLCVAPIERDEQGPCTQLMMLSEGAMECGAPAERHPDDLAGILQPHPFLGRPTKLCLHVKGEHSKLSGTCQVCLSSVYFTTNERPDYEHAFLPGHPCFVCGGNGVLTNHSIKGKRYVVAEEPCPAANCVLGFVREEQP